VFRYRKLYGDLISESGVVCVVYVAELAVLGARSRSAGYECYAPDGSRRVVRAHGAATLELEPSRIAVRFDTVAGPFSYELQRDKVSFEPHRPSPHLGWQVLAATSPVRVTGVAGERELLGHGYSDRVELSAPPRALGLSELAWGRGQAGPDSFVFTEARFRDRRVFRHALVNGSSFTEFALERARDGSLELGVDAWRVRLEDQRCLHAGDAIDDARFPDAMERGVSRVLSGAIRERRALARVRGEKGEPGRALHERVHFGAPKDRE
jgi:hypothetical protein